MNYLIVLASAAYVTVGCGYARAVLTDLKLDPPKNIAVAIWRQISIAVCLIFGWPFWVLYAIGLRIGGWV